MVADTRIFREDPLVYLESKVVIVPATLDDVMRIKKPGEPHSFELRFAQRNVVWLSEAIGRESIRAYYLPWSPKACTTLTLGSDADYFFTSEFTNCRFAILDGGNGKSTSPKVAHVAGDGTGGMDERDKWEHEAGFLPTDTLTRRRGFDAAESSPRAREVTSKHKVTGEKVIRPKQSAQHNYGGADGRTIKSSAFIFGRRVGNIWQFYAQVTDGKGTEQHDITLSSDLDILKWKNKRNIEL